MDRPHAAAERVSADAARQVARMRAGFAAAQARRAAAARRRGALAVLLVVASVGGWVALVLAPTMSVLLAALPSVLLAVVMVTGRTAVVAGQRNDERWRGLITEAEAEARVRTGATRALTPRTGTRRMVPTPRAPVSGPVVRRPEPARRPADTAARRTASGPARPRADLATTALPATPPVGRAVHPSEQMTDVFDAIVSDRGETGSSVRHASVPTPTVGKAKTDATWSPVQVPPPPYTLKPPAPRIVPVPLEDGQASAVATLPAPAEPVPQTSGSIDLDAVLERRRASGL